MFEDKQLLKVIKRVNRAYDTFFGSLVMFMGSLALIPNEVVNASDSFALWVTRLFGFVIMLVAAMVMKDTLLHFIKRFSSLHTFMSKNSEFTIIRLGIGLTLIAMFIGLVFAYVPFVGYIIGVLFAWGYIHLVQKLRYSTTTVGKVLYVVMLLLIVLAVFLTLAFMYLTRDIP